MLIDWLETEMAFLFEVGRTPLTQSISLGALVPGSMITAYMRLWRGYPGSHIGLRFDSYVQIDLRHSDRFDSLLD